MAFGNLTDQLAILRRQDLTSTEKFVAVVALSFRNSESGRCNPPIVSDDAEKETLCSRSGYTKQCVTKTLASLEAKGVLALKKAIARPSEITFTVNDVYGKRGLPSTTITATVNDVYGKGKQRLPITDKEQIKNRQVLIGDFHPRAEVQGDAKEHPRAEVTDNPVQKCTPTPCKSAPLREQQKKQKENISSSSTSDPEPLTLTNDEKPAACTRKKAPAVPFAQIVEIYNAKLGNDLGSAESYQRHASQSFANAGRTWVRSLKAQTLKKSFRALAATTTRSPAPASSWVALRISKPPLTGFTSPKTS